MSINIMGPFKGSAESILDGNKVISSGKKHTRIRILGKKNHEIAEVRALSKKIKPHKPGFDFLNAIGLRRRVFIQVNDSKKQEFATLNAESVRKRFGLEKEAFYSEVKKGNGDITAYLKRVIREAEKPKEDFIKIGNDYLYGREGTPIDEKKAFEFYQKAASAGKAIGYGNQAFCYSHGKGVLQNSAEAKKLLEKAMEMTKKKEQRALLLEKYAKLGVKEVALLKEVTPIALNTLGQSYLKENKIREAVDLFEIAADAGNKEAKWNLTYCLLSDGGEEAQDAGEKLLKEIVEEMKKFPNEDNDLEKLELQIGAQKADRIYEQEPLLYFIRGRALITRRGAIGASRGFDMIQKAAALHVPEAIAMLAFCYKNGQGVEKDELKAATILKDLTQIVKGDRYEKCLGLADSGYIWG